jgi:hypothetical protein
MAAALVTSALRDPGIAEPAGRVYQELYYQQYGLFRELARLFYASNRTVDSYFWEARRIIGAGESLAPREAFIRAAAGQPPRGYERVVLEEGVAPEGILEGVQAIEGDRRARQQALARISNAGPAALGCRVPELLPGARVERKPVLGDGVFEWGYVVAAPDRPDVPVSATVAALVDAVDGHTTVAEVAARVAQGGGPGATDRLATVACEAVGILFVDGLITALREG